MDGSNDFKQQEVNFVYWAKVLTAKEYDIDRIITRLKSLGRDNLRILDVGGGIGAVARLIADSVPGASVDVVDHSVLGRKNFINHERTRLIFDDFLNARFDCVYDAVIIRTVLHHILGKTEGQTAALQATAIAKARDVLAGDGTLFVTENFYEPFLFSDLTGGMIFQLTRIRFAAPLFRRLGANTAGEGVRFRSLRRWKRMFHAAGFEPACDLLKQQWKMPLWQRIPFLCRDRYQGLLEFRKAGR